MDGCLNPENVSKGNKIENKYFIWEIHDDELLAKATPLEFYGFEKSFYNLNILHQIIPFSKFERSFQKAASTTSFDSVCLTVQSSVKTYHAMFIDIV